MPTISPRTAGHLDPDIRERLLNDLVFLYGRANAAKYYPRLAQLITIHKVKARVYTPSQKDAILISYADHVQTDGRTPLQTMRSFAGHYLEDIVNTIHLLPFYPSTGDEGFSVSDFRAVDSKFGFWDDFHKLRLNFRLMIDGVFNHTSISHPWFKKYLDWEKPYSNYYVTIPRGVDVSMTTQVRPKPLLTKFQTKDGVKQVWTTFSSDQADLNYGSPDVLMEIVTILLFYVGNGCDMIRLDSAPFYCKLPGTTSLNVPQTHAVLRVLRTVIDAVAPFVQLMPEAPVYHPDNVAYLGNGQNEGHIIYNFALPPLIVHAIHNGDASYLTDWARNLSLPSDGTCFFNFTAVHDGIRLRVAEDILPRADILAMANKVKSHAGAILYRNLPDGTIVPYEMCATFYDALTAPNEPLATGIDRFMLSQSIAATLAGIPGIYFGSLFGAPSWDGPPPSHHAHDVARVHIREKFQLKRLDYELADPTSRSAQVYQRYRQLMKLRGSQSAFHPHAPMTILNLHPGLFTIQRTSRDWRSQVMAIHNLTDKPLSTNIPSGEWTDLFTGARFDDQAKLAPYQVLWLRRDLPKL